MGIGNRKIFAILLSLSAAVGASAGTVGFTYERRADEFALVDRLQFTANIDRVIAAFQDNGLTPRLSNILEEVRTGAHNGDTYKLYVTGSKFGVRQTTVSLCRETTAPSAWTRDCSLLMNEGEASRLFHWGRTLTECKQTVTGQTDCVVTSTGRMKDFNLVFYTRTAAELGLDAVVETLDLNERIALYVSTKATPEAIMSAYPRSLQQRISDDFFNRSRQYLLSHRSQNFRVTSNYTLESLRITPF